MSQEAAKKTGTRKPTTRKERRTKENRERHPEQKPRRTTRTTGKSKH